MGSQKDRKHKESFFPRIAKAWLQDVKICPKAILVQSVCYPFAIPTFSHPFAIWAGNLYKKKRKHALVHEKKNSLKKTRSRPRKRPRKKKVFLFFQNSTKKAIKKTTKQERKQELDQEKKKKISFFLDHFLGRVFVFLFSLINSHLCIMDRKYAGHY